MRIIIHCTDETTIQQILEVLEDADQNELFDDVFATHKFEDSDFERRWADE